MYDLLGLQIATLLVLLLNQPSETCGVPVDGVIEKRVSQTERRMGC